MIYFVKEILMIRTFTMSGSETKIEVVNPWVADLTKENLDTTWITEAYGRGLRPGIMFKAADSNSAPIYIAENTGDSADKQFPLFPGKTLTLDYSVYVDAMNVFYVTGMASDILSVICR